MSFNPDSGSIASASDAALSNPADDQVLTYSQAAGKWVNQTTTVATVSGLQAALDTKAAHDETIVTVRWTGSAWPDRPESAPFGVMFLSTNDPEAPAPDSGELQPGDIWQRYPDTGG